MGECESWIKSDLKADLKNATGVNISDFAKKAGLACLNSDIDELDID